MSVTLPPNYRPSRDEPFMNSRQLEYYQWKLLKWREELIADTNHTLQHLKQDKEQQTDFADRASVETGRSLELRTRDRERKLVAKIDASLGRIENGTYGYCEETGEPINLRRLEARPIAMFGIDAQERHERREKVYRDD